RFTTLVGPLLSLQYAWEVGALFETGNSWRERSESIILPNVLAAGDLIKFALALVQLPTATHNQFLSLARGQLRHVMVFHWPDLTQTCTKPHLHARAGWLACR